MTTSAPQGFISRHAPTVALMIVSSAASFVLGQARADATQDAKIDALTIQIKETAAQKVSRDEFLQFTKSVEVQLQMVNENLMALRREAKRQ